MNSPNVSADKFDTHYRQQLSALMDGELPADEARFLLRRLQHDEELNAQWERWQLLGDALRGRAEAPAPAGFAQRVADALAAEPAASRRGAAKPARTGLLRWGGGALAASVAALALFVAVRPAGEEAAPIAPLASTPASVTPAPVTPAATPDVSLANATELAPSTPVAPAVRPASAAPRRVARAQPVRDVAVRDSAPVRTTDTEVTVPVLVAAQTAPATPAEDPFSSAGREVQARVPAARPWPRSVLRGYPSGGAFNASFGGGNAAVGSFHPFEPGALPSVPPLELPAETQPPETQPQD